jgi:hypothetical protein
MKHHYRHLKFTTLSAAGLAGDHTGSQSAERSVIS